MDKIISSIANATSMLQTAAIATAALMILISGYFFLFGGDEGPRKAKKMLIYVFIGLILILGANVLAQWGADQVAF
ncbi:hypothetical protein DD607_05155 [Salmonella sp. 3DZ2-4SM]|uniref:TrbC/VirB2 family protein n=1 Tax=Mammaliicoccus sciuri TaxID=1296 RepID=A0AB37HUH8_MAMSC|nr:TrbC/VirB2 family protein [Mammaliicoccus sciuri]QRN92757.1 TrbC/VirB2 family protein [Mammaliicoccus sciuri]RXY94823.1 hypothetical protein DD607_05155 [Salmonella sp. 3DZ2-4SM]